MSTENLWDKISNGADLALFLPFLLLYLPALAAVAIIGEFFFGISGIWLSIVIFRWTLKIMFAGMAIFLASAFIIGPWIVPGWGGFALALFVGSWLTPLGVSCLLDGWLQDVAMFVLGLEIPPINPRPFIVVALSIGFGFKFLEIVLRAIIAIIEIIAEKRKRNEHRH
jgi:hypothetical protein